MVDEGLHGTDVARDLGSGVEGKCESGIRKVGAGAVLQGCGGRRI